MIQNGINVLAIDRQLNKNFILDRLDNKQKENTLFDINGGTFNDDIVNIFIITENNQKFENANEIAYNVKNSVDNVGDFIGNIPVSNNVHIIEIIDNKIIYDGLDNQNRFVFNVKVRILWQFTKT